MNRTALRTLTLAVAVALSLTSCGGQTASDEERETSADPAWQSVLDGAYAEGELSLYNAASEVQNERMMDAWEERYPQIDLRITRGGSELPARVGAELGAGTKGADAFIWSDPEWFQENVDKLSDLSSAPSVTEWNDDFWAVEDKAVIATRLPWTMIVWNTDKFPNGFENYEDLLAPEVKGQLGSRSQVTVSIAGYLKFMEDQYGDKYMKELAKQNPKFYTSAVPLMQAVASGEIGVSNVGVPATVLDLQKVGAPIDYAYIDPGFAFEHAGGALKDAAHPNAAVLFMNWFMSEEGQQAYNGDGLGGAGRSDVEGALTVADSYTMLDSSKFPPEEIARWEAKFHGWFG